MKTLILNASRKWGEGLLKPVGLFVILLLSWPLVQRLILYIDPLEGDIGWSIIVLIIISLICFFALTGLCWWLLQRFWLFMELPSFGSMVLRFDDMESWQQLGFYFGVYALLLLAGVGCLAAIC